MEVEQNYNQLQEILDSLEYKYEQIENDFSLLFEGNDVPLNVTISVDNEFYRIEGYLPSRIPSDKFFDLSIFFGLLNPHFRMGHFLIYRSTNEVVFRVTGIFKAVAEDIESLIALTLSMVENHLKPIMSIAFNGSKPTEAYDQIFDNYTKEEKVEV